jgi:hypothetical protein
MNRLLRDTSPISAFVGKMIDAHQRRLRATSVAEKRAIEREMEGFLAQYLESPPRPSVAPPTSDAVVDVPRATSGRRRAHVGRVPSRYAGDGFDHKLAAAGDRGDDE